MTRLCITMILVSVVCVTGTLPAAEQNAVISPNGKLKAVIECAQGKLHYNLILGGRAILKPSLISILKDASYQVTGTRTEEIDKTWQPVWGQLSTVRDHCNELTLDLTAGRYNVAFICRAYDDGVGFRFPFPEQPQLKGKMLEYVVEYCFDADYPMYHPRGEVEPKGPIALSAFDPADRGPGLGCSWERSPCRPDPGPH